MVNTVLLNNVDHANLKAITRRSAEFGDNINQVLIFPTEFEEIQREYPIFFRKDAASAFQAVALLGLDKGENLFLDEKGWQARYLPAVQERGPFLIGFQQNQVECEPRREPMIHVDIDHPRISEREGEPLFLAQGGNSPYLERIARILRVIHQGVERAKPMFDMFQALEMIEPIRVEIKVNDAAQYNLPDFYTIGADTFAELDGADLEQLHQAGFLRPALFAMSSLANVNRLIELKNRKRA